MLPDKYRKEAVMKRLKYLTCRFSKLFTFLLFFLSINHTIIYSQYFGQNKPSYRRFNFKVYQTPNFEIYHYLENDSVLKMLASRSEAWYKYHQAIFRDTINERNPILFYENHAEFQQTNAVSDMISEGTGGVTEALKQRVIMPLTPSFAQTDHVLGHELVHAFQYNLLINTDSLGLAKIRNLPLWMVEGMAEYFSIGSIDPHTAMWMRDAVLTKDIPSLRDMTRTNKYFPYRYGQAVMALIGKAWSDSLIVPLFAATANNGFEKAFEMVLGIDDKAFSGIWKAGLINAYSKIITDTLDIIKGKKIIFAKNAGKINLSPSVSPDGKYVVFLSERDVYTLDLFLAETNSGKIVKKLSSHINRNEIDALSYLESSGTWAPDSRRFAFVVFSEGKNKLIIIDVKRGRTLKEIELPSIPAINNPSWSPDGEYIALSAMKNGVSDIFLYNVTTDEVTRLTSDSYANLQPTWSSDGKYIAFVTDKPLDGQVQKFRHDFYNIAVIEVDDTSSQRILHLFTGARNMNPLFSPDNKSIYFLSDRDGFRNLYRYDISEDRIWQMTRYMRGITGITAHAPAVTLARETGEIVYSYFADKSYTIYSANPGEFEEKMVEKDDIDYTAATLPPFIHVGKNLVDSSLHSRFVYEPVPEELSVELPYRPKFKLDYITNTSVGVASGRLGTGMAGSVTAIFGDMTGENQIYSSLSINGEIYDFGGQVAYLNYKRKLKWGVSLSHIPNYYGFFSYGLDTLTIGNENYIVNRIDLNYLRMFEDKAAFFAFYPLSQTRRFEFSGELARYSYRYDQYIAYYDMLGQSIGSDRKKLDAPKGFGLQAVDAAYVLDNSVYGITGPVSGTRYRIQAGQYFGMLNFTSTLIDYRKYIQIRPYTVALRAIHYGRWGKGAEDDVLTPMYIGYPWFVRGFERTNAYWTNIQNEGSGIGLDNFFGSKIIIANAEFRIPFSGPENISLIKSQIFFTEFNLFADGGLALSKGSRLGSDWFNPKPGERVPVFSYGASFRINLFGYAVLEPYYAVPVGRGISPLKGSFGLNFVSGW